MEDNQIIQKENIKFTRSTTGKPSWEVKLFLDAADAVKRLKVDDTIKEIQYIHNELLTTSGSGANAN